MLFAAQIHQLSNAQQSFESALPTPFARNEEALKLVMKKEFDHFLETSKRTSLSVRDLSHLNIVRSRGDDFGHPYNVRLLPTPLLSVPLAVSYKNYTADVLFPKLVPLISAEWR